MKKIIFSLIAICTISTMSFANKNPKTIDESKKEIKVSEIKKETVENKAVSEISTLDTLNTDARLQISPCTWVYVTWFIELNVNEGMTVEEAHSFASGIEDMCRMGTVVWP